MKKKYIIIGCVVLVLITIMIFVYSQMKVESIFIDIDYVNSSYFTSIMEPNKDDKILITTNSKIKFTEYIENSKLFDKNLEYISSNNNIAYVEGRELVIKGLGEVEIYCKSVLGTKSNIIKFTIVKDEV